MAEAESDGLSTPRRYVAAAAILTGIMLVVLDGAIANVALPTIATTLHVAPATSVWVVTGYQLALVVALLPCAAMGESFGYRRLFTIGVLCFTVASALCAFSPTLRWLVGARILQGLGGAAVMAPIAALLRFTYPHRLFASAISWNALTVALSFAAGPAIGAAILSIASWPWLFAVNIPVGTLVLVVSRALPTTTGTGRKLDLVSVVLNAGVFAPLIVGVDLAFTRPLAGAALIAVCATCLVLLIRREMPRVAPLIPIDLLRIFPFRISVMASVCCFAAQMAGLVALPFYLQHGLGQDTFMTGMYMTPWPLTVAFIAPIAGRLTRRIPTGWLCLGGGACFACGLALTALWPFGSNLIPLVLATMLAGLGFGLFQTPNNHNMLLAAPRARSGAAGASLATARLIGQTTGTLIMGILFTLAPAVIAARLGLGVGAVLALAGGLVSTLRIDRRV